LPKILRHHHSAPALLLCGCETVAVALALYAAAMVLLPNGDALQHAAAALIPALAHAVLMYSVGLYDPPHVANFRRALPRLVLCLAVGGPLLGRTLEVEGPSERQLALYLTWTALVIGCVLLSRMIATPLARTGIAARRVLVVGTGRLAAELEAQVANDAHLRLDIVGYVPFANDVPEVPEARMKRVQGSLLETARGAGVKEIVVALDDRRGMPLQPLLEARLEGVRITSYLSFWERATRRVNLTALDPSWLIYADGFHVGTALNRVLKRALDIAASLGLLALTLPLLMLVTVAIKLDSRGPVFYCQERVGRGGRPFRIRKFRTMHVDAEQPSSPQWAAVGDPRATRLGGFLRRMRLDELPQIFNVLKGEMSFVGPRPERPHFVTQLSREIPFYAERHRVRPGITGWAQINYPYGASVVDARIKLSYDLYYIKNFSFLFDLLIILSTAKAIVFGGGGR
jgi:sugar transferase (PEP-CTERM system associated)